MRPPWRAGRARPARGAEGVGRLEDHGRVTCRPGLGVAQALRPRRLSLLLGQARNRADEAIAELARTATGFAPDRVVDEELPGKLRGSAPGEVRALLLGSLQKAGQPAGCVVLGPTKKPPPCACWPGARSATWWCFDCTGVPCAAAWLRCWPATHCCPARPRQTESRRTQAFAIVWQTSQPGAGEGRHLMQNELASEAPRWARQLGTRRGPATGRRPRPSAKLRGPLHRFSSAVCRNEA